ncbi:MAG: preprotein translocase subunit SecE [bacterium]|nr:preprotein translocase subunit SecE [bacterium]
MKLRLPLVPFLGSVVDEGKKVVWPTRDVVVRHTLMVIISVAIATVIYASLDFGLQKLVILALKN